MALLSRRTSFTAVAGVAVVLAAAAALYFEPWKLVVNETVQEAAPVAAAAPVPGPAPAAPAPAVVEPAVVARGELVAHEHASTGSVQVVRLADGTRVLRLQDLHTSNGPRLVVRLSAAPVLPGRDGWFVFGDDAAHVDLGPLKGNIGSSNYPIPAGVDLAALPSVSIWCERFGVSFAAAALR
jgi:Electron transfer DM13